MSTVFVQCVPGETAVRGFYTLSACQVEPRSLPPELARRLPRRSLPATLIGRLAVDRRYHGQGVGGTLLVDALARAATASREIASMLIVVDAKDEDARAFYEHYGFRRFADEPYRLFLPMADAERVALVAGKVT